MFSAILCQNLSQIGRVVPEFLLVFAEILKILKNQVSAKSAKLISSLWQKFATSGNPGLNTKKSLGAHWRSFVL